MPEVLSGCAALGAPGAREKAPEEGLREMLLRRMGVWVAMASRCCRGCGYMPTHMHTVVITRCQGTHAWGSGMRVQVAKV